MTLVQQLVIFAEKVAQDFVEGEAMGDFDRSRTGLSWALAILGVAIIFGLVIWLIFFRHDPISAGERFQFAAVVLVSIIVGLGLLWGAEKVLGKGKDEA